MKTRYGLIFLISAICLISLSATASPFSKERTKTTVHDVGWQASQFTATEFTVIAQESILYPAPVSYAHYVAIVTVVPRYERKRFVSHNSKANRRHRQLYGKSATAYQQELALKTNELLTDPETDRPVWQIIAANTKDQS